MVSSTICNARKAELAFARTTLLWQLTSPWCVVLPIPFCIILIGFVKPTITGVLSTISFISFFGTTLAAFFAHAQYGQICDNLDEFAQRSYFWLKESDKYLNTPPPPLPLKYSDYAKKFTALKPHIAIPVLGTLLASLAICHDFMLRSPQVLGLLSIFVSVIAFGIGFGFYIWKLNYIPKAAEQYGFNPIDADFKYAFFKRRESLIERYRECFFENEQNK